MKVAGYGRVSTLGQAKDGTSLEDQQKIVKEKCAKEGHELVDFYSDEGVSGGTLDRPALQRLITDAKNKRFEAVYFTKLDRLGRSVRDIHNLYHELHDECGLNLVCIDDPSLNTEGKMGAVMLGMLSTFGQFERAMIRERTMAGKAAKWDKGEVLLAVLPFGYQKNKATGKPEIINEQAAIYEKIVSLYLDQRLSMKDIAIRLTAERIPSPSVQQASERQKKNQSDNKAKKVTKILSGRWNSIFIGNLLKHPAYRGMAIYDKHKPEAEWLRIPYPPLISEERWKQIQDRIQTQRHKPKRYFTAYADHFLFNGLLYCGECGSKMRARPKVDPYGRTSLYYSCYYRSQKEALQAGRSVCSLKAVYADEVDERLFDQIVEMLTGPDKFVAAWMRDLNADELSAKVEALEKRERQLHLKLTDGFQFIAGQTNPEVKKLYTDEIRKWQAEWEGIQPELQHARDDFETVKNKVDRYGQFKAAIASTPFGKRIGMKFKTVSEFQKYMLALPFLEKRRIVEAVVAPENGGKCSVGYVRPVDILDERELKGMSAEEKRKPLADKSTYVRGDFSIDLSRIEVIINGLDPYSILNKGPRRGLPGPVSARREGS